MTATASTSNAAYKSVAAYAAAGKRTSETCLFLRTEGKRGPQMRGTVAGLNVSLFKVKGKNGTFFNVISGKDAQGKLIVVGYANVRVVPAGFSVLAVTIRGKTHWANFRKTVTQEMQVAFGLDLAKLAEARALNVPANDDKAALAA